MEMNLLLHLSFFATSACDVCMLVKPSKTKLLCPAIIASLVCANNPFINAKSQSQPYVCYTYITTRAYQCLHCTLDMRFAVQTCQHLYSH